jgi:hypothetical protein
MHGASVRLHAVRVGGTSAAFAPEALGRSVVKTSLIFRLVSAAISPLSDVAAVGC